ILLLSGLVIVSSPPLRKTPAPNATGGQEGVDKLIKVLRQPMPPESDVTARDALARQQAQAAVALLKFGRRDLVWPLLKQTADNSRRTYLVHGFARLGADPLVLFQHLEQEPDASSRRALILSMGEF